MTEQELDRTLRRALADALALDWAPVLEAAPPAELSPRQRRRIRAMLADPPAYARRACRPLWQRALRAAACLLLACSLTLGALMAASPAVRAAVIRWVTELYETHIVYRFAGEQGMEALPAYTIGELPEGYADTGERVEFQNYKEIPYENIQGQRIYLTYTRMNQGNALGIGLDNIEVLDITVNGCPGQLYLSTDGKTSNGVVWIDEKAGICFTVDGFVDEFSLLHIAESVYLEE